MADNSEVLEVPDAGLIDSEFLFEVFEQSAIFEVRAIVPVDSFQQLVGLESFGFRKGRSFAKGKTRFQRLKLTKFDFVRANAESLMREHELDANWEFAFDSARQRAGLCNYTDHKISLSKYIVEHHSIDQCSQVVLHEIAHALAGKSAGHGPNWKAIAKRIGYRGEKFTGKEIAEQTARWVGECPSGHRHYRFKSPKVQLACGYCGRGFNRRYLISWTDRAA